MNKNLSKALMPLALAALVLNACKKDDTPAVTPPVVNGSAGAYILSEGNFGTNNTKLAFYTVASAQVTGDFFLQQNPTIPAGLGDTGNDGIIYGSKLYIIMNGSGNVTVLNAANATFVKTITGFTAFSGPRYAVGTRGKVYVTAYDNSVKVIDTTSLTIVKTIPVGANPEGIAVADHYLYVANSGAFNPTPDSTVSLIDLNTELEVRKIKVGVNPNKVEVTANGNVFVSSYGNFGSIAPSVSIVNTANNTTSVPLGTGFTYSHIRAFGNLLYCYNNYPPFGGSPIPQIKVFNAATGFVARNEFVTDGTPVTASYGVNVDQNGDVWIADAGNFTTSGKVTCFNEAGVKKFSFSTAPGISPNKIIFKQ